MSTRTRDMDRAEALRRAQHARDFLEAATDIKTLHPERTNVVVSNAVHAGIAAAYAICGKVLHKRSVGEDHRQAVDLLSTATVDGKKHARDLARLLDLKNASQYSAETVSESSSSKAVDWATRLVDAMEGVLRTP